jgi:hypothetical protein
MSSSLTSSFMVLIVEGDAMFASLLLQRMTIFLVQLVQHGALEFACPLMSLSEPSMGSLGW